MPNDPDDPDQDDEDSPRLPAGLDGKPIEVDLIRRGGAARLDSSKWSLSIIIEDPAPSPNWNAHFEHEFLRSSTDLTFRINRGDSIRERDWWRFVFEGAGRLATDVHWARDRCHAAMLMFRDDNERWIAFHYIARTSPSCVFAARGDANEETDGPPLSLLGMSDVMASMRLASYLKLDREVVEVVIQKVDRMDAFLKGVEPADRTKWLQQGMFGKWPKAAQDLLPE